MGLSVCFERHINCPSPDDNCPHVGLRRGSSDSRVMKITGKHLENFLVGGLVLLPNVPNILCFLSTYTVYDFSGRESVVSCYLAYLGAILA